jgi:hypothetical protein
MPQKKETQSGLISRKKIEVPDDAPFSNDKLKRKKSVDHFIRLLGNVKPPFTFSLNGKWGSGKTIFLKMLEKELLKRAKEEKIRGVHYLNIWESDFLHDPMSALISAFEIILKKEGRSQFIEGIKKTWRSIGSASVGFSFMLYAQATASRQNSELDLQEQVEGIRQKIQEATAGLDEKIIIIVDELDRCRPNYSIDFLERIKHFFDVDNVVFVLGIEKDQLCEAIRSVYGQGFDAERYLNKFINIEINLPTDKEHFISQLASKSSLNLNETDHSKLIKTAKFLERFYSLSLRDLEQLFNQLALQVLSSKAQFSEYPIPLVLFLINLKFHDYNLYTGISTQRLLLEDVKEKLLQNSQAFEFEDTVSLEILASLSFMVKCYDTGINRAIRPYVQEIKSRRLHTTRDAIIGFIEIDKYFE